MTAILSSPVVFLFLLCLIDSAKVLDLTKINLWDRTSESSLEKEVSSLAGVLFKEGDGFEESYGRIDFGFKVRGVLSTSD